MSESTTRAAQLIAGLRAGAGPADAGQFTLAETAAAEKLKAFRYEDRARYLLPLVEGLRGLGAVDITLEPAGGDLVVLANAVEFDDAVQTLGTLFGCAVARDPDGRTWALGRLAVAIDMVSGQAGLQSVGVEVRSATGGCLAQWKPGAIAEILTLPASAADASLPSVRVLFDWSTTRELASVLRRAREPDVVALETAASVDPMQSPIRWGHSLLSAPEPTLESVRKIVGDGFVVRVGQVAAEAFASEIMVRSAGLVFERLPTADDGPSDRGDLLALIDLERPPRDLSQMALVHDETYRAAIAAARQAITAINRSRPPKTETQDKTERRRLTRTQRSGLVAVVGTIAVSVAGIASEGFLEMEKLVDRYGRDPVVATVTGEGEFSYEFRGRWHHQRRDPWELVFAAPLGADKGEELVVWVHPRDGDVLLQSSIRGNIVVFGGLYVAIVAAVTSFLREDKRHPVTWLLVAAFMLVVAFWLRP